jgi:hypothetical protein
MSPTYSLVSVPFPCPQLLGKVFLLLSYQKLWFSSFPLKFGLAFSMNPQLRIYSLLSTHLVQERQEKEEEAVPEEAVDEELR